MVERDRWWPVALADALDAQPLPVTLLDEPLVLWRTTDGVAHAFADRCPHRGARLSMGAVVEGQLQCPYHGWRFDGGGRCRLMPSMPGFEPPSGHVAQRHAVTEAHGLLWACLGDPGVSTPPVLPELPPRRVVHGPFDVATSAPRAVENFLDTSHFAFVHAGWLGDAAHTDVPHHELTHTADGRPVVPDYPAWQPRATASSQGGAWVRYRYEVLSPYAALLQKQPEGDAPADAYVMWACPTTPESCRAWFVQYTTDAGTPDDDLLTFQATIFSQDRPVLESQSPKRLPIHGGERMCAADRLSAAYRRYLRESGITFGVC